MASDRSNERSAAPPRRRVHGRRVGHRLRAAQLRRQAALLPEISIDQSQDDAIDLKVLFNGAAERVLLEIGFGAGEHLAAIADENPDDGFIGCEPFINGVAQLLKEIEARDLQNIRIFNDDARNLMDRLPDKSIDEIFLLFPDPWPKKRHHKRRFICPENLTQIARILKLGGVFQVATDQEDYLNWILRHMLRDSRFQWSAESADDWRKPPYSAQTTRYAKKALRESRMPTYLQFTTAPENP